MTAHNRVRCAVFVISALLMLAACGDEAVPETSADTTVPASEAAAPRVTTTEPAPTTSTAAATTSSDEDPLAPYLTFTEIAWEGCELLDLGDGSFTVACGFRTHPLFENLLVKIQYEMDDDGLKTGVFGDSIRGYGPTCEWVLPEGASYAAPLVDGVATYEGVLIGSGLCEGAQWSFTQVWDDNARTVVTSGMIERIG